MAGFPVYVLMEASYYAVLSGNEIRQNRTIKMHRCTVMTISGKMNRSALTPVKIAVEFSLDDTPPAT
jgi:hypothetical protein